MHSISLPLLAPFLLVAAQEAPDPDRGIERLREHYRAAEHELRCADVEHLTANQSAARTRALDRLGAYRERGEFGVNTFTLDERRPVFVDAVGRPCAVANLMLLTGERALVDEIAAGYNLAYIAELSSDRRFAEWLDANGLSFDEAARIQGPAARRDGGLLDPGPPRAPNQPVTYGGPGDGPGSTRPGGAAPRGNPASPSSPGGVGSLPSGPTSPVGVAPAPADWWQWWEFNRMTWITPQRLEVHDVDAGRSSSEAPIARLSREVLPLLAQRLEHDDPRVRAAATIAYGRLAGDEGAERLAGMIRDPRHEVREAALLGLGATGSERAVLPLLHVLRDGDSVDPFGEPLAALALAVARRRGAGERAGAMLVQAYEEAVAEADEDVELALLLHQTLEPSDELGTHVRCRSELFPILCSPGVRGYPKKPTRRTKARAIETLRFDDAEEVLAPLLRSLGARDVDARRSTALALGALDHPNALQPLETAYETEREPLARGLLLVAIGDHGGSKARRFLARQLERGPHAMRPWSALALGILARGDDDEEARAALRVGFGNEKNRESRGAYFLALGIAEDEGARELLVTQLAESRNARDRMFAAQALGLVGGEGVRDTLRAAAIVESSPLVRATTLQALAIQGDPRDAELLLESLEELNDADLVAQLAVAVAYHGSSQAALGLVERVRAGELGPVAEAAALQALGMMLDPAPPFALAELSRRANFVVFPTWLYGPLLSGV